MLLCVVVLLSGCLSVKSKMKPVSIGMPMEQVKKNLGDPHEVTAGRDGQRWEYRFSVPCSDCRDGWETETAYLHFDEYGELEKIDDLPGKYLKP